MVALQDVVDGAVHLVAGSLQARGVTLTVDDFCFATFGAGATRVEVAKLFEFLVALVC